MGSHKMKGIPKVILPEEPNLEGNIDIALPEPEVQNLYTVVSRKRAHSQKSAHPLLLAQFLV